MSPQSANSMEGVSAFTLDRVNSLKLGPFGAEYSFLFFLLLSFRFLEHVGAAETRPESLDGALRARRATGSFAAADRLDPCLA